MDRLNRAQLPLYRYLLPGSLVILAVLGACEWGIAIWIAQDSRLTGLAVRMTLAAALVGFSCYLLYRRQRIRMLVEQEELREQFQRELSEHKTTEQALADQLRFLQILVDAIPAPIFYKDADGIYTGCNRAFETFLGKPREEIIGRSVYGVSPGPQARVYHEKDIELMRQRGQQIYESQVVYADGSLHDVIFNKAAYALQDGRLGGLIGVILDITERKALERDLMQAKEKAEFYSRSKTRFLTNMSHEIRTPLNAIVGFSQVLNHRSSSFGLPQEFHGFLEKIATSGQQLAELVNDVLDISRIEAGKIEAIDEDFQLCGLIQDILTSCEPQAAHQHLRLHCDIDPDLPEFIRIDRGKLSQILINLIGNAIKFSPANSDVAITLEKRHGNILSIAVADHGIGIAPQQQAIIFEPFEQVDKSLAGQSRGTGLGLPITRSLVELLGGTISLESNENVGARFTVELPLREGTRPSLQQEEHRQPGPALEGVQILIFEDNTLNQALMQAFCDDLKLIATFVADGLEGVKKAQEIRPDMIFMDVQLPGLSGIEATKRIRQNPELRHIPIIGLSAAAFKDQQSAALDAGMNDYLTKPVAFPQLISAINRHLV
ncbi:ATP-binding protein [Microbulbifer harenosus]|uniref:histidine kinase n=1 Tax=Microbulbifer harenosus TaxID=2576840 RepID=A0ABY2ULA9_9GAMM|nr:ATP-binding protein [Microbulbifer harenosus]TLM77239.1 response regulator [Microbulbifer harenosus]